MSNLFSRLVFDPPSTAPPLQVCRSFCACHSGGAFKAAGMSPPEASAQGVHMKEPGSSKEGPRWNVYKFGGTSCANAGCYRTVQRLVLEASQKTPQMAVVVSAMGGKPKVTDLLIDTVTLAARGNRAACEETLALLRKKHFDCASSLFSPADAEEYIQGLEKDINDLRDILRAVSLMKYTGEKIVELVSGHGELWSARMLALLFQRTGHNYFFIDARKVLKVNEEGEAGAEIMWDESRRLLEEEMARHPGACPVITGFIASTMDGVATTLKRDGSDYSASIFGRLLSAGGITIWTDVDGVLSADPRRVPEAQVLPDVSYDEAMELAYFGAKVIHPKTMTPAVAASIPIYIRNTFNPTFPGTRIFVPSVSLDPEEKCVRGFSTIDNVALLNLEGSGMIGVPGIAHRLFGAIKQTGISVILIAQASSEQSISFACKQCDSDRAKTAVEEEFFRELKTGMVSKVDVIMPCSIIAAVGDGMSNVTGVAGKFCHALGSAQVNILAISQGSSERNISAVVKGSDSTRSLRAVHAAFLLSNQVISVGLVGTGRVGTALAEVMRQQAQMLYRRYGTEFHVRAIMNANNMVLSDTAMDLNNVGEFVDSNGKPTDMNAFTAHVLTNHLPHSIIIDCSDSEEVATWHATWLEKGIHVVTANKKGLCGGLTQYNAILRQRKMKQNNYMYEVTVGGGLKLITTLQGLLHGGDRILKFEGALSASMNYILSQISPAPGCNGAMSGQLPKLSEAVAAAAKLGIVERDAMRDVSGTEMAQKVLVLGREMGYPLRMDDMEIEALLPPDTTLDDLPKFDELVAKRLADVASRGRVLRYAANVDEGGHAKISLVEVEPDHAYARLKGACFCFRVFSDNYGDEPLTIQGNIGLPKATAAGLFSDLLFVAQRLGAKDKGHVVNGSSRRSEPFIDP